MPDLCEKLCWRVIAKNNPFHLFSYVKLAKYLEQKIREFEETLSVVEEAINHLSSNWIEDLHALEYEMKRKRAQTA